MASVAERLQLAKFLRLVHSNEAHVGSVDASHAAHLFRAQGGVIESYRHRGEVTWSTGADWIINWKRSVAADLAVVWPLAMELARGRSAVVCAGLLVLLAKQ